MAKSSSERRPGLQNSGCCSRWESILASVSTAFQGRSLSVHVTRRSADLALRLRSTRRGEASMRGFLCACLLCCSLAAQDQSSAPPVASARNGSFSVNGVVYRYEAGTEYTVVAAAHTVLNHKFVALKVRVYNLGQHSVTVKPEEVSAEDTLASQALAQISSTELARRM